jgi:hypothetical protein
MEPRPARIARRISGHGFDDEFVGRVFDEHDGELADPEARAHLPAQHLEQLGEIERPRDRMRDLQQQLHLADVRTEARVDRLQLGLERQVALHLRE